MVASSPLFAILSCIFLDKRLMDSVGLNNYPIPQTDARFDYSMALSIRGFYLPPNVMHEQFKNIGRAIRVFPTRLYTETT